MANAHRQRKEYDQAISAAKEDTRLAPGDWRAWMMLGKSYTDTASYAEAIESLQRGKAVAPDEMKSTMLLLVGDAYAKKGDREQVLRIYQELKASDPKMGESFFKEYVLPK